MTVLGSCEAPPRNGNAPSPDDAPTYLQLIKAHNERVAKLKELYADGVLEIRWVDDKGKHFEQGNMELWLSLPRKTSLRVEKVGREFLWLGSDEQQFWLFDLLGEEKVLYLGRHDAPAQDEAVGGLIANPMRLLDLMMLSTLPLDPPSPSVRRGRTTNAWVVETTSIGGPIRIFFDPRTLLPQRVETLSATGEILLYSTLDRHESVALRDTAQVEFPKLAHVIEIASTDAAGNRGAVKIVLDRVTGGLSADKVQKVFDLERLKAGLQPRRVEWTTPQP